ncbi:DUF1642 domain-containing protein [Enterococcus durans]|uniref:DUF1642 domain-containing protein n=1 Tax=Enterococcus durans TaxID=53345 RepID=UPI003D6B51DE
MNKQELIDKQALIDKLMEMPGIGSNSDALEMIKRFPVYEQQKPVVPECFDIDYKKYEYLKNNKSEILMTAIGGIHRVSFPGSFKDLPPFPSKDGIKWNKWTRETILWASRNYADFCQAVISGDYEVEKEPVWGIKNVDSNYLTKCALWGKDGVNYSFECNPSYKLLFTDKARADATALLVNGTAEEVEEG